MNDSYVVLHIDLGVLGIGREQSYGMDVTWYAEGIEYQLALEPDEYIILGYYDPVD